MTSNGKVYYRESQVELGMDAAAAIMEWYERINTCAIYKKFYTCSENHNTTVLELWDNRSTKTRSTGLKTTKGVHRSRSQHRLRLVTPWGTLTEKAPNEVGGPKQTLTALKVALGINLLLHFLQDHAEKCGDIIAIKTNIGPFVAYIAKDCYPRTTDQDYI